MTTVRIPVPRTASATATSRPDGPELPAQWLERAMHTPLPGAEAPKSASWRVCACTGQVRRPLFRRPGRSWPLGPDTATGPRPGNGPGTSTQPDCSDSHRSPNPAPHRHVVVGESARFRLRRLRDLSGVSGVGVVALGVAFPDGAACMRWMVDPTPSSNAQFNHWRDIETIHGHAGATVIEWIDPVPSG